MDKVSIGAVWNGLPIAPLIFVACLVIVVVALFGTTNRSSPDPVARPLLTPRESAMFMALEEVLPMFQIYPQVAMGALLAPPRRIGWRVTPADRNIFSQKIVDFVIFDQSIGRVVALVELDDRTHRADRDALRDENDSSCRLPDYSDPGLCSANGAHCDSIRCPSGGQVAS